MAARVTHPEIVEIACADPAVEYSYVLPAGSTRFKMQAVDADVRVGVQKGATYKWTLKASQPQVHEKSITGPQTLWFSSGGAGTVQIWTWA